KLDWSDAENDFVHPRASLALKPLVASLINQQLGEDAVKLE
ncbi:MAG: iron donor protein CyaY, partial [Silvibacterium sp.]|nr:iron donor protein CyaY [Silvibacterium sp.]